MTVQAMQRLKSPEEMPGSYGLPAPDRFAPPREEDKKHPFALVGFGSGPHGCLGFEFAQMEMKIVLSTLLRQYDWTVLPDRSAIAPVRQPSKVQDSLRAQIVSV